MAQVLCVYRKVSILKKAAAAATRKNKKPSEAVTVIAYDERPASKHRTRHRPDSPPEPGVHQAATSTSITSVPTGSKKPPDRIRNMETHD